MLAFALATAYAAPIAALAFVLAAGLAPCAVSRANRLYGAGLALACAFAAGIVVAPSMAVANVCLVAALACCAATLVAACLAYRAGRARPVDVGTWYARRAQSPFG